jgi:hypothetical protein
MLPARSLLEQGQGLEGITLTERRKPLEQLTFIGG